MMELNMPKFFPALSATGPHTVNWNNNNNIDDSSGASMAKGAGTPSTSNLNHEAMSTSSIADFFTDKHVFITGATGFVGQALVEKILRSCPKVGKLYLLIRTKKGCDASERLEKTLKNEVFNRVRDEMSSVLLADRVVAVAGDISEAGLGLSDTDRKMLCERVNVVIHSAATVRFDEPLRTAIRMNLCAVNEIINLCKDIHKLNVLMHVSTAYSNAVRSDVQEIFYPSTVKPQQMIDAIEWMDDSIMDTLTPYLIGAMPNTYTFTKQLAETLLQERAADLPVAIIRPSIITAAWEEPYPGWTCSMCGPAGLYIALGKGFMRVFRCNVSAVSDCIPVDLVVNSILAATWYTGTYKPDNINIYNVTTGSLNPHTWKEMRQWGNAHLDREPLEDAIRFPYALFTNNRLLVSFGIWFHHYLPAYTGDLVMKLLGKKPKLVRIYDRLHKAMDCLTYFTSRDWNFGSKNLDMLIGYMSSYDKQAFCLDPRILKWPRYFESYCKGVKHYILKEKPAGIPAAVRRNKMLRKIEVTVHALCVLLIWKLARGRMHIIRYIYLTVHAFMSRLYRSCARVFS